MRSLPRIEVAPDLLQNLSNNVIEGLQEDLEAQGLTPQDLWPRHSPEDAHRLVQIQSGQVTKTTDELLKLAARLKKPAKQTLAHWSDVLKALVKLTRLMTSLLLLKLTQGNTETTS